MNLEYDAIEIESRFLFTVNKDAEIFIDTESIGVLSVGASIIRRVFPGQHLVDARSVDGSYAWSQIVNVAPGEQKVVQILLLPTDRRVGVLGEFIDHRDNTKYKTVTINGLTWLGENLKFRVTNSYCYGNNESVCQKHGRLYTSDAARTALPGGWHLPKREEWQGLFDLYGATSAHDLQVGGISNFNLLLSGGAFRGLSGGLIDHIGLDNQGHYWEDFPPYNDGNGVKRGWCIAVNKQSISHKQGYILYHKGNASLVSVRAVKNY